MLVKLRNLIVDTDCISSMIRDEEKKEPTHHVFLGEREFEVDAEEFAALEAFLKPMDLMAGVPERFHGLGQSGTTERDARRSVTHSQHGDHILDSRARQPHS